MSKDTQIAFLSILLALNAMYLIGTAIGGMIH